MPSPEQATNESEPREKVPTLIRPFEHTEAPGVAKWLAVDRHRSKGKAPRAETTVTSKRQPPLKRRYPNVEAIKETPDCPKRYQRGKNFLPNRTLQLCPRGMKMFHDWYLRALSTDVNVITARFPENTFGGPVGTIAFDFDDVQTMFRLGYMETNLIRVWCL